MARDLPGENKILKGQVYGLEKKLSRIQAELQRSRNTGEYATLNVEVVRLREEKKMFIGRNVNLTKKIHVLEDIIKKLEAEKENPELGLSVDFRNKTLKGISEVVKDG